MFCDASTRDSWEKNQVRVLEACVSRTHRSVKRSCEVALRAVGEEATTTTTTTTMTTTTTTTTTGTTTKTKMKLTKVPTLKAKARRRREKISRVEFASDQRPALATARLRSTVGPKHVARRELLLGHRYNDKSTLALTSSLMNNSGYLFAFALTIHNAFYVWLLLLSTQAPLPRFLPSLHCRFLFYFNNNFEKWLSKVK